jgi:nucleoid DNA-binding protein
MAENKTKITEASVAEHIASIEDESRRNDCQALVELMSKVTKQDAKMWGASIVGFGSYHYKYESGREGDSCVTGFSSRKGDISVYVSAVFPERDSLLSKLGKHKVGKACVYIRKLTDVDLDVLKQIIAASYADTSSRHAQG